MHVARSDRDELFDHGKTVDVEAGGEVDRRRHWTVSVHSHQVILRRDGRWSFRIKFPRNRSLLDVDWLGSRADDPHWLCMMGFWTTDRGAGNLGPLSSREGDVLF